MSKKILIFTTEMLPGLGYPTAGGGIRAWQIGEGLKSRGYEVLYSLPKTIIEDKTDLPELIRQHTHISNNLNAVVAKVKPDIVVCIQWHHANKLHRLEMPLVLDLFGLLMLENAYFDVFDLDLFFASKIEAFAKADYFICASDKQKAYFFTWMVLAGIDPKADCIASIPVSLSPELPKFSIPDELTLVFGGVFWPWQDPFTPLNLVIKKMDELQCGKLKIFGSVHPYLKDIPLTYAAPEERLVKSPRVERYPMLHHEQLMQEYVKASFAVDLMMPNNERLLAYPIRTVCYLWSGLPVVISDFCDIAQLVKEYQAGWVVDPSDQQEVESTIQSILKHPEVIPTYKTNAQRLVREQLTWDKTIEPLSQYCLNPKFLQKNDSMIKQLAVLVVESQRELGRMGKEIENLGNDNQRMGDEIRRLYEEIDELRKAKADLEAIRSKLLYRLYHKVRLSLTGKHKTS
ncbi:MAG: glycosyltransferase family 4 protein [bacterium]|nr:glycosyltransferase family 4 protein [bacterium]